MLKRTLLPLVLAAMVACQSTPSAPTSAAYWVQGAVSHAGRFAFSSETTLLEAVGQAQPLEAIADLSQVQLNRPNGGEPLSFIVDVEHMVETGDSRQNVLLRSGDVIFVPSADLPAERHRLVTPTKE